MSGNLEKLFQTKKIFQILSSGLSMEPILKDGDILIIKKVPFSKIKINDIVVFKKENKLIAHRVIYKKHSYLITKGDKVLKSDGKIYQKEIFGKVFQVKREKKFFYPETLYLIQSSFYFQEIVKIKKKFEKAKIDFLFLKGLPLHLYFENRLPQRLYADCDLLINKKDFKKGEKILFDLGYQKAKNNLFFLKNKEIENTYYKKINGFFVFFDLHLEVVFMMTQLDHLEKLYPQSLIDKLTIEFLKTKRKVILNNENFFILNPLYLIIYLALHLFHHNFQGGFRYQFLDTVIRKTRPDWKKIKEKADEYQLKNFLYPVFFLLKKYYQTPIPSSFLLFLKAKKNSFIFRLFNFKKINIFDNQSRIEAGIKRFFYLFIFSPIPFYKRVFVFFNIEVIFSLIWVLVIVKITKRHS